MNISVFIIECIIMAVLFGILVFGMLFTSPLTFISDYPPEIQEEYYRSQNREAAKKTLSKIMAVKKIAALLVALFLFAWMAHKAGAETFVRGGCLPLTDIWLFLLFLTPVSWTGFFLRISRGSAFPGQNIWRRNGVSI